MRIENNARMAASIHGVPLNVSDADVEKKDMDSMNSLLLMTLEIYRWKDDINTFPMIPRCH